MGDSRKIVLEHSRQSNLSKIAGRSYHFLVAIEPILLMSTIPESSVISIIRGACIGWVAMIAVFASYMFLLPHGPHFAPEVGPVGIIYDLWYCLLHYLSC